MQNWQSPQPASPSPLMRPSNDERLMALCAHLSLLVPQAGLIAPLLIWLLNQDKAPFAAYQAKQALFFHLLVMVVTWVLALAGIVITILTLGLGLFVLIPLLGALQLVPMVLGIIGAVQSYEGRDFRYPLIGQWVQP